MSTAVRQRPPRVSVITPVYNAGKLLRRTLRSVASQTYRDHEVVIVDDGSTDPATLVEIAAASRLPGVTCHRIAHQGPAAARNHAIERSRGAYIVPLDADDYFADTYLEETVRVLDEHPEIGVAYTWIGFVGGHRGTWRTGRFSIPEILSFCSLHVTGLYRREVWEDVGGYDPRFVESCEDWDFWVGAAARGWKGHCIPKVLAYYRRTATSRAIGATDREVSARLMRTLVAKHRALYAEHLDDALAGLYEEYTAMCLALERVYRHPAVSLGVRLRQLLQRNGGA
jgi:glycosyltransferase involved in cell wall biosynthesis